MKSPDDDPASQSVRRLMQRYQETKVNWLNILAKRLSFFVKNESILHLLFGNYIFKT